MKSIFNLFNKKENKNVKEKAHDKKMEDDLMKQIYKFREETKSLDHLRKEMEEVNQNKDEVEILDSLSKAFEKNNKEKIKKLP